jgi:hypothetical protein
MSTPRDKKSDLSESFRNQLEKETGAPILALFIGYITEDGRGHGFTGLSDDVEVVDDTKANVEVTFLTSIRDAIDDILTQKRAN